MADITTQEVANLKLTDLVITDLGDIANLKTLEGPPGPAGFSPGLSVNEKTYDDGTTGWTVTIKPDENTSPIPLEIRNGKDGTNGKDGAPGNQGNPGWTPVVNVNESNNAYTMSINYEYYNANEQPTTPPVTWYGGQNGQGGSGLNLSELMSYFGKISIIKPQNDDGQYIHLSAELYKDEQCISQPIATIDTSTQRGRNCIYAFIGSTTDDAEINASWIRLNDPIFENGIGPEYDNYPILIDITKAEDIYDDIIAALVEKRHLYLKYSWYWKDDDNKKHHSDTYSLVFPSISETGASSRNKAENKKVNEVDETNDDDMYVVYPNIPNVINQQLTGDIKLLLADYSFENEYKMQFFVGNTDLTSLDVYTLNIDGIYRKNNALTSSISSSRPFARNTKYFIALQLDMVTQLTSTPNAQ